MPWCFCRCFPGLSTDTFSWSKGKLDLSFGSKPNLGEIPQIQVFDSCYTHVSISSGTVSAVWSQTDMNSPSIVPILLKSYCFNGPTSCLLAGRARSNYFIQILFLSTSLYLMCGCLLCKKKICTHGLVEDVGLLERKKIYFSGYVAQLLWYPSV